MGLIAVTATHIVRSITLPNGTSGYGHKIWCPGCERMHMPRSATDQTKVEGAGPLWDWDQNIERPTFSPSYLAHVFGRDDPRKCHSFIQQGNWHFLGDCYHDLRAKTIPLPPLPDWVLRWYSADTNTLDKEQGGDEDEEPG